MVPCNSETSQSSSIRYREAKNKKAIYDMPDTCHACLPLPPEIYSLFRTPGVSTEQGLVRYRSKVIYTFAIVVNTPTKNGSTASICVQACVQVTKRPEDAEGCQEEMPGGDARKRCQEEMPQEMPGDARGWSVKRIRSIESFDIPIYRNLKKNGMTSDTVCRKIGTSVYVANQRRSIARNTEVIACKKKTKRMKKEPCDKCEEVTGCRSRRRPNG